MYAFFDVDGTLLSLKSMLSFQEFYYRWESRPSREMGEARWEHFRSRFAAIARTGKDRLFLNREFYRSFLGRRPEAVRIAAEEWYLQQRRQPGLMIAPTRQALRAHQERGHVPVFVSGSLMEILVPVARELEVEHCLATRLEVHQGRYTGALEGGQMIGQGKADAIRVFLARQATSAEECFAYGDDFTDVPMLEAVGHPVAVIGDPLLAEHARRHQWPTLSVEPEALARSSRE
jgi:HAD superfamily hydrolase (TIGR01490 family)